MEQVQLSEVEKQLLSEADDLGKLASLKGWHLALKFLDGWATQAEERRDACLSSNPKVMWALQMVARERRACLASLVNYIAEAKKARTEVLCQIFNVDKSKIDEALQHELDLRAEALNQ